MNQETTNPSADPDPPQKPDLMDSAGKHAQARANDTSPPRSSRIIEVGAGLVFRQGTLLITQRPHQGHLGGLWEFPGGKRETGESFETCVQRELMEELGITVDVGLMLEELTHEYPEKTVHLKFFRCQWRQHEPQALGCPDFRWITSSQLKDYEFPAADARLLSMLATEKAHWNDPLNQSSR